MLPLIVAIGVVLVSGLILVLYAIQIEPYRPRVRRLVVTVPSGWPRLTILHLSDIHVRAGNDRLYRAQERLLRSVAAVPDLVCVTGDVCEHLTDAPAAAALIGLARPRLETLIVLGNHEHGAMMRCGLRRAKTTGWGRLARLVWRLIESDRRGSGVAEAHAIGEVFTSAGYRVLMNEGQRVDATGGSIWVAGCDSLWSGCDRPGAAFDGSRPGEPCLGLVHEPNGAIDLIARGADLVLSGHTHGGQIGIPFVGTPYTLLTSPRVPATAGLHRLGRGFLHISSGFGQTVPLRLGCPPSITWIECIPATTAADPTALGEDRTVPGGTAVPAGG